MRSIEIEQILELLVESDAQDEGQLRRRVEQARLDGRYGLPRHALSLIHICIELGRLRFCARARFAGQKPRISAHGISSHGRIARMRRRGMEAGQPRQASARIRPIRYRVGRAVPSPSQNLRRGLRHPLDATPSQAILGEACDKGVSTAVTALQHASFARRPQDMG